MILNLDGIISDVSGAYAGLTFARARNSKHVIARRRPIRKERTNPTEREQARKKQYQILCYLWCSFTPERQRGWNRSVHHPGISGYDTFMSNALRAVSETRSIPLDPFAGSGCHPKRPCFRKPPPPPDPACPYICPGLCIDFRDHTPYYVSAHLRFNGWWATPWARYAKFALLQSYANPCTYHWGIAPPPGETEQFTFDVGYNPVNNAITGLAWLWKDAQHWTEIHFLYIAPPGQICSRYEGPLYYDYHTDGPNPYSDHDPYDAKLHIKPFIKEDCWCGAPCPCCGDWGQLQPAFWDITIDVTEGHCTQWNGTHRTTFFQWLPGPYFICRYGVRPSLHNLIEVRIWCTWPGKIQVVASDEDSPPNSIAFLGAEQPLCESVADLTWYLSTGACATLPTVATCHVVPYLF